MNCRNERYQSKVMGPLPVSADTFTALVQKPLSASPVTTQAGLAILWVAAWYHCKPSQMRSGSHSNPASGWLVSLTTHGGSWTTSPLRVLTMLFMLSSPVALSARCLKPPIAAVSVRFNASILGVGEGAP